MYVLTICLILAFQTLFYFFICKCSKKLPTGYLPEKTIDANFIVNLGKKPYLIVYIRLEKNK